MVATRNQSRGMEGNAVEVQLSQGHPSSQVATTSSEVAFVSHDSARSEPSHSHESIQVIEDNDHVVIENYGKVVDKHILKGWLDKHLVDESARLPRIPLCRLLPNPCIRTNDDEVESLKASMVNNAYQPTMAGLIVTECMPGEEPIPIDRRSLGSVGYELRISAEFDEKLIATDVWKHMEEKMFIVWDGNHRLRAWQEWASENKIPSDDRPLVECRVVRLLPNELAEFLMVLRIVNR